MAAIVPATDRPPGLDRCLAALRAGNVAPDELIVERDPASGGPASARNLAATATRADVLVFVDADVEVHRDALARIRDAFAADPDLAGLFGSYDDTPGFADPVSRFRNLLHHHVHTRSAGPATTFWTGLGAVRREAFDAVGGFDAERFDAASVEDIELGMRLHAAGLRIVLDPSVQGTHHKRWTLRGMVAADYSRRGVPWTRLLLERRQPSRALNLSWRDRGSAALSAGGVAALVCRRPALAGAAAVALLALNARFYALLARRGGPALVAAGLPLHALHHLTSVAAAITALAGAATPGRRPRSAP